MHASSSSLARAAPFLTRIQLTHQTSAKTALFPKATTSQACSAHCPQHMLLQQSLHNCPYRFTVIKYLFTLAFVANGENTWVAKNKRKCVACALQARGQKSTCPRAVLPHKLPGPILLKVSSCSRLEIHGVSWPQDSTPVTWALCPYLPSQHAYPLSGIVQATLRISP